MLPFELSRTLTPLEPFFEPLIRVVPEEKRRLGGFIFLAAIIHFIAFTFIQVRYPQPTLPVVSGLRVMIDNPDPLHSTARTSIDTWGNLLDPSALILSNEPVIKPGEYKITPPPLFQKATDDQAVPPSVSFSPQFLPDHAAPLVDRVQAAFNPPLKTPGAVKPPLIQPVRETVLQLSPELQSRLPRPGPVLPKPVAGSLTESGVTQLRIGVDPDGHVEYALVEQSCGKSATDDLAVDALHHVRFDSVNQPGITWGRATLFWQFQGDTTPVIPLPVKQ